MNRITIDYKGLPYFDPEGEYVRHDEIKKELDLQVDNSKLKIPALVLPLHEDAINRAKEQFTLPSRVEDLSGNGNHAYAYPNNDILKLKKLLKWALEVIDSECTFPGIEDDETPNHICGYLYRPDEGYCEFCDKYWEAKEMVGGRFSE